MLNTLKRDQIKEGAILSYVSLFLNTFISLLYTPFMLFKMGQSEFGLYSLAISVVGYLTILDFGFGSAAIRYIARYRALDDKNGEFRLNGLFFLVYTIIGILTAAAGYALFRNVDALFAETLTALEVERARILILLLVFNLAVSFPLGVFGSIITAYERFIFLKMMHIARILLNPCIMIPLLIMGYRSIGLVVGATFLNLAILLLSLLFCFKKLGIHFAFQKMDFGLLKEIVVFSLFGFLTIMADRITWTADHMILGVVSGTIAVAVFSVAAQINTYFLSFSTALSGLFLPRLTAMFTNGAHEKEFSDIFIKIGRLQYLVVGYVLGGFLLVGQNFINHWAGQEYEEAFLIACILMVPVAFPLIQNTGISILQAQNKQKFRAVAYILIAAVKVGISIPLARAYGGIGCAAGTAIVLIAGTIIIMNIYYYKVVHLDIPGFWKEIGKMTIPMVVAFSGTYGIIRLIGGNDVTSILIHCFIYTIAYMPMMWFFGMNDYEKRLIGSPFVRIRNERKDNLRGMG